MPSRGRLSMTGASSHTRGAPSSRSRRFKYRDGDGEELPVDEIQEAKERQQYDTWRSIFIVTQFWIVCFALVAFLVVATTSIAKLSDRQILETKDIVSQTHTWFKFAICLRPFMTSDVLKEIYEQRLNLSFDAHVGSLSSPDEEKATFKREFFLDNTLDPVAYQKYFTFVHPWKDISPYLLWELQNITIRRAFEEFSVNMLPVGTIKEDKGTEKLQKGKKSKQTSYGRYATLSPPQKANVTKNRPSLVGEYFLSPLYLGCVSMTVNEEMGNKQMEIGVKFRPTKTVLLQKESSNIKAKKVSLFEAADIFVLNKDDSFTEIPTIKQTTKFSVMANTRERLLVKSSMFIRQQSKRRNCEAATDSQSEMTCRQGCVYSGLLEEINCTIPWMERFRQDPRVAANYAKLPMCTDLDGVRMLQTITAQEAFLSNMKIVRKNNVQKCLRRCLEPCKSSLVRILSLGSKSIGSNYGVTLTVSPALDVVKEHFNYSFANLVSELCASVSFLLGLSAIAIYDWLVALGVWAADKMGLYVPQEEEEKKEEEGKREGDSTEAREDDGGGLGAASPPRGETAPARGEAAPAREEAAPTAAPDAALPMKSEEGHSGAAAGRKRRVSIRWTDGEQNASGNPVS